MEADESRFQRLTPFFRYDRSVLPIRSPVSPLVMPQHPSQPDATRPNSPHDDAEVRTIELGQFIKWMNLADTGGQAKYLIQSGMVEVNGELETRRRRKLVAGDLVCLKDREFVVEFDAF